MFKMSTFSLVFIKTDHGVLSIYPSLVTPSFGLHRPHVSSKIALNLFLILLHFFTPALELNKLFENSSAALGNLPPAVVISQ